MWQGQLGWRQGEYSFSIKWLSRNDLCYSLQNSFSKCFIYANSCYDEKLVSMNNTWKSIVEMLSPSISLSVPHPREHTECWTNATACYLCSCTTALHWVTEEDRTQVHGAHSLADGTQAWQRWGARSLEYTRETHLSLQAERQHGGHFSGGLKPE